MAFVTWLYERIIPWAHGSYDENEETLGEQLEPLCTKENLLASSTYPIFKIKFRGKFRAVKRIVYDKRMGDPLTEREWKLQRELDDPNVLKIIHLGRKNDYKYIVMELCAASLNRLFLPDACGVEYRGTRPPNLTILFQIASGVAYIHSKNVVHRDLKPENILISYDGQIKVADFGCAKPTKPRTGSYRWTDEFGTRAYHSSEILRWNKAAAEARCKRLPRPDRGIITNKTDVFSVGIVFHELLTGGIHPFGNAKHEMPTLESNILNGLAVNFDGTLDQQMPFIRKMIAQDPNDRPSMEEVKKELQLLIGHQ